MSTLRANIIDSTGSSVNFSNNVTVNGDPQWVDTYGVIKTNRNTITENITIPAGVNGISAGDIVIESGYVVTVNGEWVVI